VVGKDHETRPFLLHHHAGVISTGQYLPSWQYPASPYFKEVNIGRTRVDQTELKAGNDMAGKPGTWRNITKADTALLQP
jgi:hypothetical protein